MGFFCMLEKCVDAVWQCVSAISSYFSANFWSVDVVLLELCKKNKEENSLHLFCSVKRYFGYFKHRKIANAVQVTL